MEFKPEFDAEDIIVAIEEYLDEGTFSTETYRSAYECVLDLMAICQNGYNREAFRDFYKILEAVVRKYNYNKMFSSKEVAKEKVIKFLQDDRQYTDDDINDWMSPIDEVVDKHWKHLNVYEMAQLIDE